MFLKKVVFLLIASAIIIAVTLFIRANITVPKISTPSLTTREKLLDKYTIDALSQKTFESSPISIGDKIQETDLVSSRYFFFNVEGKKVSGLINIPKKSGALPIIVMFRGYIDRENYSTGVGTQHAGEVLGENGFITLSPDFLGYGQSDNPSENVMEERFQTYITAITLLNSVNDLNTALAASSQVARADPTKVGIWGHSNGGQIALTVLEISQKSYPAALWAPVSKPFPYSILYYTDDIPDHGKALRKVVADFEKNYDAEKYSLANFLDRIQAPIQLHQGGGDEAVPQKWSDELNTKLKDLKKDITYFTYPGDDHNFAKSNWSTVVARDIAFYREKLKV